MQRDSAERRALFLPAVMGQVGGWIIARSNLDVMRDYLGMARADRERIETISNQRSEDSLITLCDLHGVDALRDLPGWTGP